MKTFDVDFELGADGWWLASVRGVEGCFTQGRTLEQSRKRVREALEVSLDDPKAARSAKLVEHVKLPPKVRAAIARSQAARARAAAEEARAAELSSAAVKALLRDLGVSLRDAAALLGLSHQRIHQLAQR